MNTLRSALIVLLLSSATAVAAPASDGSIRELLVVTKVQTLLDGLRTQIDLSMNRVMQEALKGKVPTARQHQAIANMKSRIAALVQGEFAWEKLEPTYLRLYRESFTEEEVAGMLSFYKTPAGQAVINRMPVLTQNFMVEAERMLSETAPHMQKIQDDFIAEWELASN